MPTITFTLSDGYPSLTGSKRIGFRARQTFTDGDTIVYPYTLWKTYPHNTEQTVTLLEGQWEVHGLANQSVPFDVPAGGGDLWALIAANLEIPATTPAQRIVAAVESWMSANVNTEVTDPLINAIIADPGSDARAALDANYAPIMPDTTITYDGDDVASVTENGVTTTYTYNPDGTVATDTRAGVTRTYSYAGGNLVGIEVEA